VEIAIVRELESFAAQFLLTDETVKGKKPGVMHPLNHLVPWILTAIAVSVLGGYYVAKEKVKNTSWQFLVGGSVFNLLGSIFIGVIGLRHPGTVHLRTPVETFVVAVFCLRAGLLERKNQLHDAGTTEHPATG
jgi:hypothetical protein